MPTSGQSVWVGLDNGAQDWEELGTGDACFGIDFIYWGYGIGGVWHQLGTASTPGGTATHEFKIARDLVGDWDYYVDGVKKGSDHWDAGIKLITGLESYADLTIGAQVFSPLWYQEDRRRILVHVDGKGRHDRRCQHVRSLE
jgi:hypothetical protein